MYSVKVHEVRRGADARVSAAEEMVEYLKQEVSTLSGQESELKKLVHDFQAKASRTQEAEEKVNQLGSLLKADQTKAKDIISKYKGCLFFSGCSLTIDAETFNPFSM
jgi:chromosome segregation ATPase